MARLAIVFLMSLLFAAACAENDGQSVSGQVVSVIPSGIDSFSSLTIEDSEGTLWTFQGGRFPEFTPSHLTEHQIAGEAVRVTYEEAEDGTLTVIALDDA